MKAILSSEQIKAADTATIQNEPIASIDLMERAAEKCFLWIKKNSDRKQTHQIVCGSGNNGGDGLAIARMLHLNKFNVKVHVIKLGENMSIDCTKNFEKVTELAQNSKELEVIRDELPTFDQKDVIVDALFGTGLSRPAEGFVLDIINKINESGCNVISIDMPSGLCSDNKYYNAEFKSVVANATLTFQTLKSSMICPDLGAYCGKIKILDIGLDNTFIESLEANEYLIERSDVKKMFFSRSEFSHKGNYGHVFLMAGSTGKTGAAVLSVNACLRSGCGLTTAAIPGSGYQIIQTAAPEAMSIVDEHPDHITSLPSDLPFNALGFGPGVGTHEDTAKVLKRIIQDFKGALVIDADGLNILAQNPTWLAFLPQNTILTPHPGEFERLVGKWENGFERNQKLKDIAVKFNVIVVLKGKYTAIAAPNGSIYFNPTGNPGMSKGGSGDVLTGLITGLAARGLTPLHATITGVYIHGLAGDYAAKKLTQEAMTAGDIIRYFRKAFKEVVG